MIIRKDIQGLRALAILLVLAAHFSIPGFSWGFVGVDIFFVISGYLITGIIYEEYKVVGKFNYVSFYARRFRRLLPAMTLMIVVTLLIGYFILSPKEHLNAATVAPFASIWLSNFYFAFTAINYFDAPLQDSIFLHTWSLGVEEQFYLFWPIFLMAAFAEIHKSQSVAHKKNLLVALSVFIILSLISCIILSYMRPTWAYYMMPTRLWQFALGGLGYYIAHSAFKLPIQRYQLINNTTQIVAIALLVSAAILISPYKTYPGYFVLLPSLAAFCFLIIGGTSSTSKTTQLLGVRPMKYLGNISYSLYLWHWPTWILSGVIIENYLLHLSVSISLTLILSICSYYFFESPIRNSNFLKSRMKLTIAASAVCMISVFCMSVLLQKTSIKNSLTPEISFYEDSRNEKPWIYNYGCDKWYFSSEVAPCIYGQQTATHVAVIFGDSVGAQWIPAIQPIYNHPDWKIIIHTKSACSMLDEKFFYPRLGRQFTECEIWRENVARQLNELHPDVVFMGSAINTFSKAQWIQGTQRLLDKFSSTTGKIFIFRATPVITYDAIDCLIRKKWINQYVKLNELCEPEVDDTYSQQVFEWQKLAVKNYPNVSLIDLNEVVCPNGICNLERDGQVVYRDNQHLSVKFVKSITSSLYDKLIIE